MNNQGHNLKVDAKVASIKMRSYREKNREYFRDYGRKRMQTGVLGDEQVLFYGYKEPLTKFENGFGYKGVLSYSKDKDKIQCHFCGRLFRCLNNGHLMKIHGLTATEYKDKVDLSQQSSLTGEGTRVKFLERDYNPRHMEVLLESTANRNKIIQETGKDPYRHPKMSLEMKNKRGTCPDQLLDIIDKTIKSHGRVMTAEEFSSFHAGKYMGSIRATFGTWTKALEKLGHRPNNLPQFSRDNLIEAIKNFFEVNQRTPHWSDFERGLLPSPWLYYREFKNLNHARQLAGVPLVFMRGRHNK